MIGLWLREWKRERRGWIGQQIFVMVCSLLVFLIYMVKKVWLFRAMLLVKSLPEAAYAFLGLTAETETGNLWFYLLFTAMLLNVYVIWEIMTGIAYAVYSDERSSAVYTLCSQWYSRGQLMVARYLANVFVLVVKYLLWYIELCLFILVGSITREQRVSGFHVLSGWLVRSIAVSFLLMSVVYLLAVSSRRGKQRDISSWGGLLVFGTLALGNLYKIRNLVIWIFLYLERDVSGIMRRWGWLNRLYWISPLSWVNPFAAGSVRRAVLQVLCSFIVGIGAAACAVWCYNRRELVG